MSETEQKLRKSHRGIESAVSPGGYYPGIPDNIKSHHYYFSDAGHVIMVIPTVFRKKAARKPDDYETGVPIKYVLSHPYTIEGDYIYINVPYDEFGVEVPEEYVDYRRYYENTTDD